MGEFNRRKILGKIPGKKLFNDYYVHCAGANKIFLKPCTLYSIISVVLNLLRKLRDNIINKYF